MIPVTSHFDVIVLGQGLAGTALAWTLRWSGARVLVLDRDSNVTASKIAAGLITPITGQKLVMSWRYAKLWPAAEAFYRRVEAETSVAFFQQPPMVRLFANESESALFERRLAAGEFHGFIHRPMPLTNDRWFVSDHGGFEMRPGGQLDIPRYLLASREYFNRDGGYITSEIDVSREIELVAAGVRLPRFGVSATKLIFCQGVDAVHNPWFSEVQLKPAKGEILTVRISGLTEDRVVHRGIWLAPLGGELFRVGSTYDWKCLDSVPTPQGRDEIIFRLREFLRLPFEVVSHSAAVRPIHRNQYPVVGLHPVHLQFGYFNGLGSKGSLHAPFFAHQFVSRLNNGGVIDPDVDLNRKTKWRAFPSGSSEVEPGTGPRSIRHVERRKKRSLTEQAQDAVRDVLMAGENAIDATAGNGHDTQFLAEQVGPNGTVFAFDVQQVALDRTSTRLMDAKLRNVSLINCDHSRLMDLIPVELRRRIAVVMFNLGYLPGGDKGIMTQTDSTRIAIGQAAGLLRSGGVLTILAYTGHAGGADEALAVESALDKLPTTEFEIVTIESQPGQVPGPRLFLVKRRIEIGATNQELPV